MTITFAFLGQFGDAIDFIFSERESPAGGSQVGGLGTRCTADTAVDDDRFAGLAGEYEHGDLVREG